MSLPLKQVLFASSAAISLIAPVTETSAQYRYYDRPSYERHQRPPQGFHPQQTIRSQQTARPQQQTAVRSNAKPATPVRPAERQIKPAEAPLTEEQIAAKAAVDELLAREAALNAAKDRPDPALVRAAAAKHNAQDARLAALKARQESEAAKRRELEEKNRAREEAKMAVLKAKQEASAKNAKPKVELVKPAPATVSVPQAPSAPVQPVLRMPAPEGLPLARNL